MTDNDPSRYHTWLENGLTTDHLRSAAQSALERRTGLVNKSGEDVGTDRELTAFAQIMAAAAQHIDKLEGADDPIMVQLAGIDGQLYGLDGVGYLWRYSIDSTGWVRMPGGVTTVAPSPVD